MLAAQNQLTSGLLATNPLDPTKIVNVTSQAIVAEEAQTSPSESPTPPITPTPPVTPTPPPPTPSKFGTPSVITSPVPYLITNGTVVTTDPSITTNGVTDYGKIYRGQTMTVPSRCGLSVPPQPSTPRSISIRTSTTRVISRALPSSSHHWNWPAIRPLI